ncbi:hypothetical protein CSIM01_11877 [Colletotrichum simmondsii]|uniref:Uncharacterized protein n=1 Tax=Colletotrichum simmondsii TaxID=703756 RepID=A0A135TB38_9PEZI|nr:hypothetical protein CSIM01_11877 [Colletotrichum simmondsii]
MEGGFYKRHSLHASTRRFLGEDSTGQILLLIRADEDSVHPHHILSHPPTSSSPQILESSTTNPTTGDIHTMRTTPPNPMGLALPPRFFAPDLVCRHLGRKAVALGLHHILRGASYSTAPYFPSLRPLERRAVREYIRGLLTLDEKEYVMRDLAAHAGWHQEVLCALEWVKLAL